MLKRAKLSISSITFPDLRLRNHENYLAGTKLGRGRYSEAYLGLVQSSRELCVIKILKPIKKRKILRYVLGWLDCGSVARI